MHSKNNRVNKDFQIAYFLAGACHTADGAYSLLKDLQEDREMALSQLEAGKLREQAKILQAQRMLTSIEPDIQLEGKAILAEIKNGEKFAKRNIEAAERELEFINKCIEKIQPHRLYSDLPDHEAYEATEYEEWKMELISRAENHLLTTGFIPTDQFATMRQHPAFISEILPAINNIKLVMSKELPLENVIHVIEEKRINIPKLLELKQEG